MPASDSSSDGSSSSGGGGGAAVAGAVVGVLLLLLGVGMYVVVAIRKKKTLHLQKGPAQNFEQVLDAMLETGRIDHDQASGRQIPREIERSSVRLVSKLGSGQFGDVWKGLLDESGGGAGPPEYLVAVKTVKMSGRGSGSGGGGGSAGHGPAIPTKEEAAALEDLLA